MTQLITAGTVAREVERSIFEGMALEDYVPPVWDGPHVGKRLIEAWGVLRRVPWQYGPAGCATAWPAYAYEFGDLNAQEGADLDDKDRKRQDRNRVRALPSAAEITHMETAIGWAARYLAPIDQAERRGAALSVARCVGMVAMWRSAERESEWIARKLRLHPSTLRRRNRRGLDLIAIGLRCDGVTVF